MKINVKEGYQGPSVKLVDTDSIHKDVISIGRNPDCDIVLDYPHVSRLHCGISCEKGRWSIQDINSSNGLYFKNQKIKQHVIHDGDSIVIYDSHRDNKSCIVLEFYDLYSGNKTVPVYNQQPVYNLQPAPVQPSGYQPQPAYNQPQYANPDTGNAKPQSDSVSGLAIASMVLGILALLFVCCFAILSVVFAIISMIFAGVALNSGKRGRGMAIAGLVCSLVSVIPVVYMLIEGMSTLQGIVSLMESF
jgi:pSer/pThr/pTyr-binding forkhead associated (FHA) protein